MGIEVAGSAAEGVTPAGVQPLMVHRSRALAPILADMGKFSNNFMAEMVLRTLGPCRNSREVTTTARPSSPGERVARPAGATAEAALRTATGRPALAAALAPHGGGAAVPLGVTRAGRVAAGGPADLVALGADLAVRGVYRMGRRVGR